MNSGVVWLLTFISLGQPLPVMVMNSEQACQSVGRGIIASVIKTEPSREGHVTWSCKQILSQLESGE